MSLYNNADVAGCVYTMEVLSPYFNKSVTWEHTSTSQNDEYCKYDMDWTATTVNGSELVYVVENKDRRINWKTKEPQYFDTYETIMFNIDKYDELMEINRTTGKIPFYTADYADGVVVFDLRKFPSNCKDIWVETRSIGKNTVEDGAKKQQARMFIPKSYGKFFPKDNNKPVINPTYDE